MSMKKTGIIKVVWDNVVRNHYVYAHYTADTNELFYIGIGTHKPGDTIGRIYQRAYVCANATRNKLWLAKYNKHGRNVEILFDNCTEKEAKEKEIELIAEYGTLFKHTGILCNISEGGEGRFQDDSMCKKIYVYNLQGEPVNEFNSCEEAAAFYNLERKNVGAAANMKRKTCGQYQFRYENNKDLDIQKYQKSPRKTPISVVAINVETGEELEFPSMYKLMKHLNVSSNSHILEALQGKNGRKVVKGWELKYRKEE